MCEWCSRAENRREIPENFFKWKLDSYTFFHRKYLSVVNTQWNKFPAACRLSLHWSERRRSNHVGMIIGLRRLQLDILNVLISLLVCIELCLLIYCVLHKNSHTKIVWYSRFGHNRIVFVGFCHFFFCFLFSLFVVIWVFCGLPLRKLNRTIDKASEIESGTTTKTTKNKRKWIDSHDWTNVNRPAKKGKKSRINKFCGKKIHSFWRNKSGEVQCASEALWNHHDCSASSHIQYLYKFE